VRSVAWIDSKPQQKFIPAAISQIVDSRNRVSARVDVPGGAAPALLTFSRPFFHGYEAWFGREKLSVDSYRGLFPIVEVPNGSHGQLTLIYRPWWLMLGGILSILCAGFFVAGVVAAGSSRTGTVSGGRSRV
jgi:hypothetical protein